MAKISKLSYQDILRLEPTFISLDISVNSTGWIRSIDGKLEWGTYSLQSEDELGRRREFKQFLIDLFGTNEYPIVYVEDVIAGTNFKTTKGLIQLNTIVDDLADVGILNVKEIKREDNKKWKKYLKQASNYESAVLKENDKDLIKNSLHEIGFNEKVAQDIYDALGLAISMIFRYKVLGETRKELVPLKMDLKRGYLIKQFNSKDKLLSAGQKEGISRNREIDEIDWSNEKRDILYLFKQKVKSEQRDDKIYLITEKSSKLGILALDKKLNTDETITYLMITKKK